eukprot:294953-Karenia_brevis.AAC.1
MRGASFDSGIARPRARPGKAKLTPGGVPSGSHEQDKDGEPLEERGSRRKFTSSFDLMKTRLTRRAGEARKGYRKRL